MCHSTILLLTQFVFWDLSMLTELTPYSITLSEYSSVYWALFLIKVWDLSLYITNVLKFPHPCPCTHVYEFLKGSLCQVILSNSWNQCSKSQTYFTKNGKKQKIPKCVSHSKSTASLNIFQVYTLDLCMQSEKNKICNPLLEGVYLEVKTPKSRLGISSTLIQWYF